MTLTDSDLEQIVAEGYIRLSLIGPEQLPVWEASPSPYHQVVARDIEASIRPTTASGGCDCEHIQDMYIRLPDGSIVRPDISIFCAPIPLQRQAYAKVPEAVIEIISPGYQAKDDRLAQTYLANGIKDVLVVNPEKGTFVHYRPGMAEYIQHLPQSLVLRCGCQVTLKG